MAGGGSVGSGPLSFVRTYTAVDASDPRATAAARVGLVRQWMAARPRELFAELRQDQPIFLTPGFVLLSRHAEVAEVLACDEVFSNQAYDERLQPLISGFMLGAEDGPAYERESALLRLALRRSDMPAIAAMAGEAASIAVATARPSGHIEVVHGLLRPILARFVGEYIGVPGPGERAMLAWARLLAHAILCDPDGDPRIQDDALEASSEFRGYVDVLVHSRRSRLAVGGPPGDDALGRLLALQAGGVKIDDRKIRDLLIGVITAAVEPTIAVGTRAIREVVRRPEVLAMARQAALTEDHAIVTAIVTEALRFAPPLWTPIRVCTAPYTLARGTPHETVVRPYTRILASTYSAGFDTARTPDADKFVVRRPPPQAPVFGLGPHTCAGRHIALVLLRAALTALLRGGAVRVSGEIGHVGPFPDLLPLEFLSA